MDLQRTGDLRVRDPGRQKWLPLDILAEVQPDPLLACVDLLHRAVAYDTGEAALEFGNAGSKFNDLTHRRSEPGTYNG